MKRRSEFLVSVCKPVLLYREDIQRLHDLLASGGARQVGVVADGYVFDSLDELLEKGGHRVESLELGTDSPRVSLTVGTRTTIYAGRDDGESRGLFEQVREYLSGKRRRRRLTGRAAAVLAWMALALNFVALGVILSTKGADTPLSLVMVGLVVVFWAHLVADSTNKTLVYLTPGDESPGFWTRNRDAILVSLGTTLVGIVVGVLLEHYVF